MNKLELKHIAPYFPYKLKYVNIEDPEYIFPVWQIDDARVVLWDDDSGLCDVFFHEEDPHLKPLLRDMSDLTKEIEHEGKRFIPLLELAKIHCSETEWDPTSVRTLKWELNNTGYSYHIKGVNHKPKVVRFGKEWIGDTEREFEFCTLSGGYFHLTDLTNNVFLGTGHQLEIFQKLFEWHFDVFGLLDKNLAFKKQ